MTTTEAPAREIDEGDLRSIVSHSAMASSLVDRLRMQTAAEIAQGKNLALMLRQQGPMWMKEANNEQVLAFARTCVGLGLSPLIGEAYLIHGGLFVGIMGRRKCAQRTGEFRGEGAPRLLTKEEETIYGVHEGDIARIVQVWREGHRMPAEGCGIVRKGEIAAASQKKGIDGLPYAPLGRDPEGMAIKRAANGAYKRGFPDLDLPTVDVDRATMRVIDVETGETLANAAAEAGDSPRLARVEDSQVIDQEPEAPALAEGETVDLVTGEIVIGEGDIRVLAHDGAATVGPDDAPALPDAGDVMHVDEPPPPEPPIDEKPGPRRRVTPPSDGRLV